MFTIRHVERDSGHESVSTAETLSYDSGDTRSTAHPGIRGVRALGGTNDPQYGGNYQSGDLYVMNDAGATVAVYRKLGPIKGFDFAKFRAEQEALVVNEYRAAAS
jgi:hypothetical protein